MGTSKVLQKNNLENLESTSEFSRVLVTFTQSMLNSTSSLLQQHGFKSICFPFAFILGLFANLFIAINFIQSENKNLAKVHQLKQDFSKNRTFLLNKIFEKIKRLDSAKL